MGHTSVLEHAGFLLDVVDIPKDDRGNIYKHAYKVQTPNSAGVAVNGRTLLSMIVDYEAQDIAEGGGESELTVNQAFFTSVKDFEQWIPDLRPTMVIHCDRGVSHELVRHRVNVFSQESQRYVKMVAGDLAVTLSESSEVLFNNPKYGCKAAVTACFEAYQRMLDAGVKPQQARMVLPNMTSTTVVMSGWMWEWLWFLELRDDKAAHPDMREVAGQIRDILAKNCNLDWWLSHKSDYDGLRQCIPAEVISVKL